MPYSPLENDDDVRYSNHWWPTVKAIMGVAATLVIGGVVLIYWYKSEARVEYDPYDEIYAAQDRDFLLTPFDMLDAMHHCKTHTREKYGDQLALAYVDEHSTRFDADKGLFKVFMVAHVGSLSDYKETAVHCFVDKYQYRMTHYRTHEIRDHNLISRVKRFFQR